MPVKNQEEHVISFNITKQMNLPISRRDSPGNRGGGFTKTENDSALNKSGGSSA